VELQRCWVLSMGHVVCLVAEYGVIRFLAVQARRLRGEGFCTRTVPANTSHLLYLRRWSLVIFQRVTHLFGSIPETKMKDWGQWRIS
jgi:hypothetical protein